MLQRNEFLNKIINALGIEYNLMQGVASTVPRIALIGASASGKSTLVTHFVQKYLAQLLMNNIESVQSSKISSDLVLLWSRHSASVMRLKLKSNLDFDLIGKNIRKSLENLCTSKNCDIDDEDIDDFLVDDILSPVESKAYDLFPFLTLFEEDEKNEFLDNLRNELEDILMKIIEGSDGEISILDKLSEEKKQAKKMKTKFSKAPIIKKLLDDRLSKIDLSKVFKILSKLYSLALNSLDSLIGNVSQSLKTENGYSIIIDSEHLEELNRFMSKLYKDKGYCLIVEDIIYYTPIAESARNAFEKYKSYYVKFKENEPLIVLQDLKGISDDISLEAGLLDNLKAISGKQVDSCLVLHSLKNPMSFAVEPLKYLSSYYNNLNVNVLCTYADVFMTDTIRSLFKGIEGPGTDIDIDNEEFYKYAVLKAARSLEDVKQSLESTLNDTVKVDAVGEVKVCTLVPDYVKDIDSVLVSNEEKSTILKLYDYDAIYKLLYDICIRVKSRYKTCNDQYEDSVDININDGKLDDLVTECMRRHALTCDKEYYQYVRANVHWNTVYAWRDKLRFGGGHTSNANVYDDISIYLSSMVQGFMSKSDLVGLLDIKIEGDVPNDVAIKIKQYIAENLETDLRNIKNQVGLSITYTSLRDEFNYTYFSDALILIKKKLESREYWKEAIRQSILKAAEQMKLKTFR